MIKRALIAPLLIVGALLAPAVTIPAVAAASASLATMPIGRQDLPWWRERFAKSLERTRQGDVGLVWLGDSITQNWERTDPKPWGDIAPVWHRFYGDRQAVNMGFSGDTTASVIWRLDHGEIDGIDPKALVLLIGANNLGRVHWGASETVAGIGVIVDFLRRRLPNTRILVLGVLPSERSPWISENTAVIDADLARIYRDQPRVTFMDVGYLFMRDGKVDTSLYLDPHLPPSHTTPSIVALHPDARGMELIATAIEPTLHHLLGDRDHMRETALSRTPAQ